MLVCWAAAVTPARPSARAVAGGWALVEIGNGGHHLLLAVLARGYSPGVATAPVLIGAGGVVLSEMKTQR